MVKNGIDCIGKYESLFRGQRLGLITSVSGVTSDLRPMVDVLSSAWQVTALFGPEHGVRGNAGAGEAVEDEVDAHTGIPVYSLYRSDSKRLRPEQLDRVDTLVYDIQDVGARYYTFISTMYYAMQSCEESRKGLIILDRLNPLGGQTEGNLIAEQYESFVGSYPICMRYGMTVGELAQMIYAEQGYTFPLSVVPVEGWKRSQLFFETGNLWMMPSVGMPRFETALVYPGTCLFEGTNVSEGRGTSVPFEMIGAPYIDADRFCARIREKKLPGVLFTPAYFTPSESKYQGEHCEGVLLHVTDPHAFAPVETGIVLLKEIRGCYPKEFAFLPPKREGGRSMIELLYGNDRILRDDLTAEDLLSECKKDSAAFEERKRPYLLYE